jgi:hypothetical protein
MNTIEKSTLKGKTLFMLHRKSLYVFLVILVMAACSRDQELPAPGAEESDPAEPLGYTNVDEALWEYFELFEQEAFSRGITIDIRSENISGKISEIHDDQVAGTCNYNYRTPNKVTIDLGFWSRSGDRYREFVVFHELGHCVLFREHKEKANAYNICESIMRSGTGSCLDNYNRATRSGYLDELFDPAFRGDIFLAVND